jgi:cell division protein FtsZ
MLWLLNDGSWFNQHEDLNTEYAQCCIQFHQASDNFINVICTNPKFTMKTNRLALLCVVSLWEATGFSPRFLLSRSPIEYRGLNFPQKSFKVQMAGKDNSEYIQVKVDDINSRAEREKKLAAIEVRKKEISRQIDLAEKERISLLKQAEKASAANEKPKQVKETQKPKFKETKVSITEPKPMPTTSGYVKKPAPEVEVKKPAPVVEVRKPAPVVEVKKPANEVKVKEIERAALTGNTSTQSSPPLDITGPGSLFGGLILAAIGARAALENRDEKQEELMLERKEAVDKYPEDKNNKIQSTNTTENEDCIDVVSDFFLGKRVGDVLLMDIDTADEMRAQNYRKYTVVNKCTDDEIIKIGDKNETNVVEAEPETKVVEAEPETKGVEAEPETKVVEAEPEITTLKEGEAEAGKITLKEGNVIDSVTGPSTSKASDVVSPSLEEQDASSAIKTEQVLQEVKPVEIEQIVELQIDPLLKEGKLVDEEETTLPGLDDEKKILVEDKKKNLASARGSAGSSGLFAKAPSPVPEETSKENESSANGEVITESTITSSNEDILASLCKIKVLAVGDGGAYAIDRMISAEDSKEVEFWAINTDLQALDISKLKGARTFAIGQTITKGIGANGNPEVGENAARESSSEISAMINGANVCIVKCGLGGGTGSGASPVICELAKKTGALTIAVVTEPFPFEGKRRMKQAVEAIDRLFEGADAVIVISNTNVMEIIPEEVSLELSFQVVDEIVNQVVVGLTNMLTRTGLSTVDFAGVNGVLKESGFAVVGMGTGSEETAAEDATIAALTSPLLDAPLDKARGVIVNVVGGTSLSLQKINRTLEIVNANVGKDCNIVMGAQVNENLGESIVSVTVIATSFELGSSDDGKEQ